MHSLDVVIPIHNELANIPKMIDAMENSVAPSFSATCLIFVDDGSSDNTFEFFKTLEPNPVVAITYLKFSRNFKKDLAVKCGIDHSTADYCAVIDGDFQQPPETLIRAYQETRKGFSIVHIMKSDYKVSLPRKMGSTFFASLISRLAGFNIHLSDFKLFSHKVAKEFSNRSEKNLFFAGSFENLGFKATQITYQVAERTCGTSNFNIPKLFILAIKSIVSISVKPLRFASFIGFLLAMGSFCFTCWIVTERLMLKQEILGFATLAGGIFLLGGLQLLFLGILGEYIGQIYIETKGNRQYIVEEEIHIEKTGH